MKRPLQRRKLDVCQTLAAYEHRINSLPLTDLQVFEGAFISSYQVWNTYLPSQLEDYEDVRKDNPRLDNHTFRLYEILKERGINCLGVTSERLYNGKFIAALPYAKPREEIPVIYVGGHCVFSKHKANKLFSITPQDKRYHTQEREAEEDT